MVTWSTWFTLCNVTTVPLILVECDNCARVAEISGFWLKGVGKGRGKWKNCNKVLHGIFLFF